MLYTRALRNYRIGTVIIWAGLFAATTVLLDDTGQLFNQLIFMVGGAFWLTSWFLPGLNQWAMRTPVTSPMDSMLTSKPSRA